MGSCSASVVNLLLRESRCSCGLWPLAAPGAVEFAVDAVLLVDGVPSTRPSASGPAGGVSDALGIFARRSGVDVLRQHHSLQSRAVRPGTGHSAVACALEHTQQTISQIEGPSGESEASFGIYVWSKGTAASLA